MTNDNRTRKIFNLSLVLIVFLAFLIGFQSAKLVELLNRKDKLPPWASRIVTSLSLDVYAMPDGFTEEDLQPLYQVLGYISDYYLYKDNVSNEEIIHGAAAGAVASLGDRYSRFIPPPDQQNLMEEIEGEYAGVGFSIIDRPGLLPPHALECEIDAGGDPLDPIYFRETRGVLVVQVFETGPAYDAGIFSDDVITCVDGQSLRGKTAEDAVLVIKGPPGTEVTITVWRPSISDQMTFTVERRVVQVPTVGDVTILENNIGYIQLNSFNNLSPVDVKHAVDELLDQGMEGLIFDLRNNTGGPMPAAAGTADIFISDGPMTFYEDNHGRRETFESSDGGEALNLPLIVLVNGNTASASEIVSGAIRDTHTGLLVGETTFGKGVVQNVSTLSDGSGLVITTGRYLTPDELEITQDGIEPDIMVNLDPERISALDPEINTFISRLDEINEEYQALREEMNNYLMDHDYQRDAALDIMMDWIETGEMPDGSDYDPE